MFTFFKLFKGPFSIKYFRCNVDDGVGWLVREEGLDDAEGQAG